MSNLTDFHIQNGVLVKYKGSGGDVIIPDCVTSIGRSAFENCTGLRSVIIPDSVKAISANAFRDCESLTSVILPKKLSVIENCLFYGCEGLTNVEIPESVTEIGFEAFYWCKNLANIVIPEGVERIGGHAFLACEKLQTITIPQNVKSIGSDIFAHCSSLREISVSEQNPRYESVGGVLFDKKQAVLMRAPFRLSGSYTIPEGTVRIASSAFASCMELEEVILPQSLTTIESQAFSWCRGMKEMIIPSGVKNIGQSVFEWTSAMKIIVRGEMPEFEKKNIGMMSEATVEFPELILTRRDKLSPSLGAGACIKTAEEYAYVWRFQSGKAWDGALDRASVDANEVVKAFGQILPGDSKLTGTQWKRMITYLELNAHDLDRTVVSDFLKIVEQKDKKAVSKFTENPAVEKLLSEECSAEQHPVEILVKKNLHVTSEYTAALKALPQGVRYADSDIVCAPMVLAYILSEYMKLHDPDSVRFVSAYKTACMPYHTIPAVDEIAEQLDRGQMLEVMQRLAFEKGGVFILPYARYADEANAAALVTQMNKWDCWGEYAATGRKNIIIARCGLLLSDTKAAMLRLDKDGRLDVYAKMRGVEVSFLRDTVLSDFGFDEEKKIRYNLGKNAVIVTIGTDLQLNMTDEKTGKKVKSVPKKDADPELFQKAKTQIAALKKNMKKVVLNRRDTLFQQFLNAEQKDAAAWQAVYLKNPVLNALAQLVVWCQEDRTFILTDGGPVDCSGNGYCIGDAPIGVAHPAQMQAAEVAAWQKYFLKRGLKQPFEQVWEPVYRMEDIRADRYKGSVISAYKVIGKEVHGISAYGMVDYSEVYGFELKDCKLEHTGNDYRFIHGQDCMLTLGAFSVHRLTRYANHIIYLFDKWTITDRIIKDDASVALSLRGFTLAQITEYIKLAGENNAVNVMAALLDYKNEHFADFDPMDIFILE